jgi:SAM-dependent methyltransferase
MHTKRHAPATERNRAAILAALAETLPARGLVLEIASGTGQHAAAFAGALRGIEWQPTDGDPAAIESIAAWREEAKLPNLRAPIVLDVEAAWPVERADAVVCINMVHIAPWSAALALFAGAARVLPAGAPLVLYGPYRFAGEYTAASNLDFDRSLRARDPSWGVRDVVDLEAAARAAGFTLEAILAMPANNHVLVFRR